jgi:molybdopterin-binding protein
LPVSGAKGGFCRIGIVLEQKPPPPTGEGHCLPERTFYFRHLFLLSKGKGGSFDGVIPSSNEVIWMKISGRNRLKGVVKEVVLGQVMAKVVVQVGENRITSVITREAAEEMGIKEGKEITALIKATEVMLMEE